MSDQSTKKIELVVPLKRHRRRSDQRGQSAGKQSEYELVEVAEVRAARE